LSRLLHLANGVTAPGRHPLRAAPSAGALYAGELYVLAYRVESVEPGVYSYHVPTHRLVALAPEPRIDVVARSVELPAALTKAPVLFLLTNVFYRYTHRYANRGYRYALIDSGHIGENLRLAAAAEGLGSVSPLRFRDDSLNALLQIDGRDEAVCALHAIGAPGQTEEHPVPIWFDEAGRSSDFAPPAGLSGPEVYHLATKLAPGSEARTPEAGMRRRTSNANLKLPRGVASAASLAWAIDERRSAARFRDEPISLADLSFLLELAQGNTAATLAPWVDTPRRRSRPGSICAPWCIGSPTSRRVCTATHRTRTRWRCFAEVTSGARCGGPVSVRRRPEARPSASPCWPTSRLRPHTAIARIATCCSSPAPSHSASISPPRRGASQRATSPPSSTTP
jgi:SagB-type dehydrogenase family enzyme